MNKSLFFQAMLKFTMGLIAVGLLLFVPAGTIGYWQGWLLIGVLFVPMLIVGIVLAIKNPNLLRKRLKSKEKVEDQKSVVIISGLMFLVMFAIAGLNIRFGWWVLSNGFVIAATVLFLLGYLLYAEVMRENIWLSRTIEVQDDQQVVDTGLYRVVRHPMYAATLLLFLTIPIILASFWSFIIMLLYIPTLVKRIRNEEMVLEQNLRGYKEYMHRVRWRLLPLIW